MSDETPPCKTQLYGKTRLYGSIDPRELLSVDGSATFTIDMSSRRGRPSSTAGERIER